MFDAVHLGNIHQATESLFVEDLSVGCEHPPKFEAEHGWESFTDFAVDRGLFASRQAVESRGLEDDRRTAVFSDAVHLATVERNDIAIQSFDISPRNERHAGPKCLASPSQHRLFLVVTEVIDIAGIHV